MVKHAEQTKTGNGRSVTKFLIEVVCSDKSGRVCTEKEYLDISTSVKWRGIELEKSKSPNLFTETRAKLSDNLKEQLEHYFPEGSLSDFEAFVPKKLPTELVPAEIYGLSSIQNLANRFKLDPLKTSKEWTELLQSIIPMNTFCRQVKKPADIFWSYYLRKADAKWGDNIKALIKTVLALPASSADAERLFSKSKHLAYDRRSRLTGRHINDQLRIRSNGPKDVESFSAAKYARAWVKLGHTLTDKDSEIKLNDSTWKKTNAEYCLE
jgi:hypothetical protein